MAQSSHPLDSTSHALSNLNLDLSPPSIPMISILPPEILSHIFQITQSQSQSQSQSQDDRHPITTATILASVSQHWRLVALNTPQLWTTIDIAPSHALEGARTHISRSGGCLLDLSLVFPSNTTPVSNGGESEDTYAAQLERMVGAKRDGEEMREVVGGCLGRCREVRVMGGFYDADAVGVVVRLFAGWRGVGVPMLRRFVVLMDSFDESPVGGRAEGGGDGGNEHGDGEGGSMTTNGNGNGALFPLFEGGAGVLEEVQLSGFGALHCRVPLGHTRVLHLASGVFLMGYAQFSEMLRDCPHLQKLMIYDDLVYNWPAGANAWNGDGDAGSDGIGQHTQRRLDMVDLLDLESLRIFGNMRSVSQLLLTVNAPRLKDLVIAPVVVDDLTRLYERTSACGQIFPLLHTLTLAPAHSNAFQAVSLAAVCFPSVKHLVFPNVYTKPFLDTFTDATPHAKFYQLEVLSMRDLSENREEALCEAVAHMPGLMRVCLDEKSYTNMDPQRMERLQSMVTVCISDDWTVTRLDAMFTEEEDRFTGSSLDEDLS